MLMIGKFSHPRFGGDYTPMPATKWKALSWAALPLDGSGCSRSFVSTNRVSKSTCRLLANELDFHQAWRRYIRCRF